MVSKPTYEELEKRIEELEQSDSNHERTKKALEESQNRFKLLYERAPLAYQSLDRDGNFIEVNPTWLNVLGYSRDEVIGKSFSDFLHPDWKDHFKENFPRFKAVGEVLGVEFEMTKKDGSLILVSFHGKIGKNKFGGFQQTHCIFQDITKQKNAEKKLAKSEKNYRLLIENQTDLVVKVDTDGKFQFVNPSYCKMFGKTKEELIGKKFMPLVHEDDRANTAKEMEALYKSPYKAYIEQRAMTKDGWKWFSWMDTAVLDTNKKVISIVGVGRDITESKQIERGLKNNKNFLNKIIDQSPFATWISDKKGTMIKCNIALKKTLNITDEQVIGKYNIFEDKVVIEQGLISKFRTVFEDGKAANFSVEWDGDELGYKGAKKVHIEGTMFPIHDDEGELTNVVNHWIDNTKRKQAEEEKIQALEYAAKQEKQALVGQIAGKMAHDFNNVLAVIMGNAQLAILNSIEDDTIKKLQLIFNQTIRGKNLTRNLVAFAKDQEPKQEFFRLSKKVDLVFNLLKMDLQNIEWVKEDKPGVPDLFADPGMIEHALVNLIQNSIHAISMVKQPRIIIRTFHKDKNTYIEIEDNGCGIPKKALDKVYEPAFTMKGSMDTTNSYKPDIKGTGYGMANVKKYIEQHEGDIFIDSKVGEGTKILISFPFVKKELTEKEVIEIQKETFYFEKYILLVEDELALSDIQYKILTNEPCNHKVDIAATGQMAIDLFDRNKYDFISLDYILPGGFNGMDVYHYIRKTNKTVPILFVSGNIEFLESIKELQHEDSNVDHISKPCQNKDYVNSINRLLEQVLAEQ